MPPKQANKFDKLNTMTKEEIIEWNFGSSSRPLQGKHGNKKKKTAACHRFTRSEVKYLIADGAGMSHADVVQLVL
jgi:hypothetical protein